MNEFIVWDEYNKKFIDKSKCVFSDGTIFRNARDFEDMVSDDLSIFNYIGKKDINNNKIYADCSIVEFGYTSGKSIGYFTFNKDRLSYDLIDRGTKLNYSYNYNQIHSLKVIGTLQENSDLLNG